MQKEAQVNFSQFTEEEQLEMSLNQIRRRVSPPYAPFTHYPFAYISGKISGEPEGNKHKFEAASDLLNSKGYCAVNPHKLPAAHDKEWHSYMRECCSRLSKCDVVFVLDDFSNSRGARREVLLAEWLKIPVYSIENMKRVQLSFWMKLKMILNLA